MSEPDREVTAFVTALARIMHKGKIVDIGEVLELTKDHADKLIAAGHAEEKKHSRRRAE